MQHDYMAIAIRHYENFPVGSLFVTKRYRDAIHLIYAFARTADDIADEGTLTAAERIAQLDEMEKSLHAAVQGDTTDPFFTKLAAAMKEHDLAIKPFELLLSAFRQDATNPIYATHNDVLEYCKKSANPVGKMMLQLFKCANITTIRFSDHICTALQLTNFLQDISVDTRRNRFYIPLSDLKDCGVKMEDFTTGENTVNVRVLTKVNVKRARRQYLDGKSLFLLMNKGFRIELRLIWHGGMRMLQKIERQKYDTRFVRPTLNWWDKVVVFLRASLD
jgi:squalene synthase HpnC